MTGKPAAFAWWAACMILTSAFLLFQVQPIISKMILPWFGGSPAVWSTCMLFFQLVLLAGYGYAHFLTRIDSIKRQVAIHCTLIALALITLPISPGDQWRPVDGNDPVRRILFVLGASVGLPYFLLSSTGPLVQAWFSRMEPGRSPYRLYALSNVGSLAALLGYPFLFEPRFTLPRQDLFWSCGFVVFAALGGVLAWYMWRWGDVVPAEENDSAAPADQPAVAERDPQWDVKVAWLFLPALASTALLAVTNHLSQDVAAVPFLWVIPLSLYLLSFIFCFDSDWWYRRAFFIPACMASVLWLCAIAGISKIDSLAARYGLSDVSFSTSVENFVNSWTKSFGESFKFDFSNFEYSPWYQGTFYLTSLFLGCMVCHGELALLRPGKKHLTAYYLMISAGGALGGIFVAIVCPLTFNWYLELPLSQVGMFLVCGTAGSLALARRISFNANLRLFLMATGLSMAGLLSGDMLVRMTKAESIGLRNLLLFTPVVLGLGLSLFAWFAANARSQSFAAGLAGLLVISALSGLVLGNLKNPYEHDRYEAAVRSFYGALQVKKNGNQGLWLTHGRIQHGYQHAEGPLRNEPTSYYTRASGLGTAIMYHPNAGKLRVGVVGLGTGTIAVYGQPGETYRFYEIDEVMLRLSDEHFSYRRDCGAKTEVVLGDARLSLEREEPQNYDVIAVDAFSGDAIPVHLLTTEAMDVYRKHLRPGGILAIHISNRYLELYPVVRGMAEHAGWEAHEIDYRENEDDELEDSSSSWVLVTENRTFLDDPLVNGRFTVYDEAAIEREPLKGRVIRWTDQFSNLFEILSD